MRQVILPRYKKRHLDDVCVFVVRLCSGLLCFTQSPVVEAVDQQLAVLNKLAERLSHRLQPIGGECKNGGKKGLENYLY